MKISKAFFLTMLFFLFLLLFTLHRKEAEAKAPLTKWELELQDIETEIEELTEMKRGYEAAALRHENQAQRLQFRNSEYLTARRHWELAEENRQIAQRIQEDIDALEKRKQEIVSKRRS